MPLAFPDPNGPTFKGVYNLYERTSRSYVGREKLTADASTAEISTRVAGAGHRCDGSGLPTLLRQTPELVEAFHDQFDRGSLPARAQNWAPVFRGSAVNNFGVRELLTASCASLPAASVFDEHPGGGARGAENDRLRLQDPRQHGPQPPRPHRVPEDLLRARSNATRTTCACAQRQAVEILFADSLHGREKSVIDFCLPGRHRGSARHGQFQVIGTPSPRAKKPVSRAFRRSPESSSATSRMPTR